MASNEENLRADSIGYDLSDAQLGAFVSIQNDNNILISGGAGEGKTLLIEAIIYLVLNIWGYKADDVAITATTALAALPLKNGRTFHSWAGIGIGDKSVDKYLADNAVMKMKSKKRIANDY